MQERVQFGRDTYLWLLGDFSTCVGPHGSRIRGVRPVRPETAKGMDCLATAARIETLSRREFERLSVQARAKIRIGKRFYAGYIENISRGGARIVTLTPIRDSGAVTVTVPDLKPLAGELRWSRECAGGVLFRLKLDPQELHQWLSLRIRKAA